MANLLGGVQGPYFPLKQNFCAHARFCERTNRGSLSEMHLRKRLKCGRAYRLQESAGQLGKGMSLLFSLTLIILLLQILF